MEGAEVVIGTYENFMLGFRVTKNLRKDAVPYSLDSSFTDDTHRGALRCMGVSPNGILASGSTDDSIRLHSLKRRREIGGLFEHNGTVNSLIFYDKNLMFSASEDGKICMWKTKNWELLRTLKGHKAQVMSIAIHPSGKLALSVGSDKSLFTWDLTTGKLAFQRKIKEVAQAITFTPDGDHYILVYSKAIEVCAIADTQVVKETEMTWRINAFCHIQDNVYAVGGDDRHVFIINVLSGDKVLTLDMAKSGEDSFSGRVRCINSIGGKDGRSIVFAGNSTGVIKAFKIDVTEDEEDSDELLSYSSNSRLTCMAVYAPEGLPEREENDPEEQAQEAQIDAGEESYDEEEENGDDDAVDEDIDNDEEERQSESDDSESEEAKEKLVKLKRTKKRKLQELKKQPKKLAKMESVGMERKVKSKSPKNKGKKKRKVMAK